MKETKGWDEDEDEDECTIVRWASSHSHVLLLHPSNFLILNGLLDYHYSALGCIPWDHVS